MLKVYNTLTKSKETFEPQERGRVKMYVCGVTVYDECHLGHARAYVTYDMIRRHLLYLGYNVTYAQNFTDVDDKIIKKALDKIGDNPDQENIKSEVFSIAACYTKAYFKTMDMLKVMRADIYPKATENIPEMIALINTLIAKGLAYNIDGDVYFAVKDFDGYGKLSGRNIDDLVASTRIDNDEKKRDPLDFALWKKAKDYEPFWESPWGRGRPGWHIECSAMSKKHLGDTFDIHGGGQDLIFPHHENEIAQSEGASGKPFVKYWLHNGFVTINKEKMSKSLKNFFSLPDIFTHYEPEVVRFYLLSTHYRSPLEFSYERLDSAKEQMKRAYETIKNVYIALSGLPCQENNTASQEVIELIEKSRKELTDAMNDDFNSARAIGEMFHLIREVNTRLKPDTTKDDLDYIHLASDLLSEFAEILQVFQHPYQVVLSNKKYDDPAHSKIQLQLAKRLKLKKDKDWAAADATRDKLNKSVPGIELEDRKNPDMPTGFYTVASFHCLDNKSLQKLNDLE